MERPSVDHLIAQAAEEQWEELDLAGMDLVELPEAIATLGHLKRLILGKWDDESKVSVGNQLTTLPAAIGQLQQLEELHAMYGWQLPETSVMILYMEFDIQEKRYPLVSLHKL